MRSSSSVAVLQRELGWVVAINGTVRPLVDWYLTEGRALEAAMRHAEEIGVPVVALVLRDGETSFIGDHGERSSRYSRVA